jgi:hypothetical protein
MIENWTTCDKLYVCFSKNSTGLVRIVHSWATYSNFHSMFEYSGMFYSLFLDSNSRQYQIERISPSTTIHVYLDLLVSFA